MSDWSSSGGGSRPDAPRRNDDPTPTSARNGDADRDRDRDPGRERERERERDVAPAAPVGSGPGTHRAPARSAGRPLGAVIAALLVGLLLGGLGATFLANQGDGGDELGGVVDDARFQAVILSNDKVYFGKLTSVSDTFFRLDRAFFLRETRDTPDAEPKRALLPVNREIHAPDNTMLIRKEEVVLVENLASDSPILTEIQRQLGGK